MSKHNKYNNLPSGSKNLSDEMQNDYEEGMHLADNPAEVDDVVAKLNAQLQQQVRQRMSHRTSSRRKSPQVSLIFIVTAVFILLLAACVVYFILQ